MELTEEQLEALGLNAPPADPSTIRQPVAVPKIAATSSAAPVAPSIAIAPGAMPTLPAAATAAPASSLGAKIPSGAAIPMSDFGAAYKAGGVSPQASFQAAIPKVTEPTAPAGSLEWQQQRQQQITDEIKRENFLHSHPWGSPESEHPGIGGKIAHIASVIGNVAGDALVPNLMASIPGTQANKNLELGTLRGEQAQTQTEIDKQQQEQDSAQAKETKAELDREKQNETEEKNQNDITQKYRKLGLKLDPQGNAIPIPYEEMTPTEQAVHDLKTNQAEAAEARAELDKLKGDPNSPLYQLQLKRLQVAMQNAGNAQRRLGLSEAEFANKQQEQELVKPSGQAQSRGSAAQAVLDLMPDLKTLVEAHRADMGPIMGRLERGEIAIGDVDPEIARLYSAMKSFYALQPAVHGFRNAEFVKDFEHALGTLERDPDAFVAGMEGLKPTMEAVAKEGKTYHKRVVEGRDTGAGGGKDYGAAPSGQAEGSTGTLPDGTKVVVKGGRVVKQ